MSYLTEALEQLFKLQELDKKNLILEGTNKQIHGKYHYLGEIDGYKVYQPLDYLAAIDLGVNTGWATAGRFGHSGDTNFTPDEKSTKQYFENNIDDSITLYYFLNSQTMFGEYALVLYKKHLVFVEMEQQIQIIEKFPVPIINFIITKELIYGINLKSQKFLKN